MYGDYKPFKLPILNIAQLMFLMEYIDVYIVHT